MNDKFKLNVFRIVQEQLNNILRHAKPTEVTNSLSQNKKSIKLTISDNGIGLNNIISRTKLYKGTPNFISQPGIGCSLMVSSPAEALK